MELLFLNSFWPYIHRVLTPFAGPLGDLWRLFGGRHHQASINEGGGKQMAVINLNIPSVVPLPCNSHHQDYDIFRRGPNLNLHLPLLLRGGTSQIIPFKIPTKILGVFNRFSCQKYTKDSVPVHFFKFRKVSISPFCRDNLFGQSFIWVVVPPKSCWSQCWFSSTRECSYIFKMF